MKFGAIFSFICLLCSLLQGQSNYEIQVYGAETVAKGYTMYELHSNFTTIGFKTVAYGVVADHQAWHETIEITHGYTSWFEIGGYLFLSANRGNYALQYVGNHIRPRLRIPAQWHCPVGISLSVELGYQRLKFANDDWTLEIRPIIDKEYKWFYVAFNPAIEYSISGQNHAIGPAFSPAIKLKFAVSKKVALGIEYYSGFGAFRAPDRLPNQFHQLTVACDLSLSPDWEVNVGYAFGLTPATERGVVKLILGRMVAWHHARSKVIR